MQLGNDVINQIVERLKPADPYKIVLFGSYAKGTADKDSDIDLLVILDNFNIVKTSSEKFKIYINVSNLLLDTNKKYHMDVIIYSRAEFNNLMEDGSSFWDAVSKTWKALYEKRN
ncbi:MAG: nucleotidyltransferase domain-containing protein [Elusimicrobiota bacterium]|jgi:predicted nucleotidyltransferase|nr:nucleotidyltransferase domain-containing protein [Elusimicrobiota bacterium]